MTEDLASFPSAAWQVSEEDRLRIACRAASIGVWQWDLVTNEMRYSSTARAICGFPPTGRIEYSMVRDVTHPDDFPRTSALARRALDPEQREASEYRYRIIRADTQEVRWVKAYGEAQFALIEGVERAVHYIGSIQDITEEKQREDALVESEARLRLAVEIGQLAVWEVDVSTRTVIGSPELNRLYGLPDDSQPSLDDLQSRYAPGELERLTAEAERILTAGETKLQSEIRHIWPDGTEKWLLMRAQFDTSRDGKGMRVLGVVADITEAKTQELKIATVARELRHRLLNTVSIISALASRSWPAEHIESRIEFQKRLSAIGTSIDLMFGQRAEVEPVSLHRLAREITDPYRSDSFDPFILKGSDVTLHDHVRPLAMAFHELCTNAVKYGALCVPEGRVELRWEDQPDGTLRIDWREKGGPPVRSPDKYGLGTTLLTKLLFSTPHSVSIDYASEGVACSIILRGLARGCSDRTVSARQASDPTA